MKNGTNRGSWIVGIVTAAGLLIAVAIMALAPAPPSSGETRPTWTPPPTPTESAEPTAPTAEESTGVTDSSEPMPSINAPNAPNVKRPAHCKKRWYC